MTLREIDSLPKLMSLVEGGLPHVGRSTRISWDAKDRAQRRAWESTERDDWHAHRRRRRAQALLSSLPTQHSEILHA